MGADGHIMLIDTEKAIALYGKEKWEAIKEYAPTCVYDRELNGLKITTFYWGDNFYNDFHDPDDWGNLMVDLGEIKKSRALGNEFINTCGPLIVGRWEVWT